MFSGAKKIVALSALAAAFVGAQAHADTLISSFTPGDLVVIRGGDSTVSNNSTAATASGEVNLYLDEYTKAGAYVGTLPVPGMTLPGQNASSHEGGLSLSVNGQWLTFGGYNTPAGVAPHPVDGTQTVVIGKVSTLAASLDTTTTIAGAATPLLAQTTSQTGQFNRTVTSVDGNEFYVANKFTTNTAGGASVGTANDAAGLLYVTGSGPTATTQSLQPGVDWRSLVIANNTLYGGTGSSSVGVHGAFLQGSLGTLPTPSNVTVTPASTTLTHTLLTNYAGGQSASNLALLNVPTSNPSALSQNGLDVMYTIGDQGIAGITKYFFDGTTWQHANFQVAFAATNVAGPTGLVAEIDPTNPAWVDLYVSGSNGIYSFIDKSGDPLTGLAANSFTQIAPPLTSDYAFYGLAAVPTPEPASLGLLALGGLTLLSRRGRKA